MKIDRNALAYPSGPYDDVYDANEVLNPRGLTKRELFAAMAMQGFLSRSMAEWNQHPLARASVICADALLAELDK